MPSVLPPLISKGLSSMPAGECWLVGGFVRDVLLGRSLADVDLVVPRGAKARAAALARSIGGTAFPLDEARGIHRVSAAGVTFDFADRQGPTIAKDLARRDFTVNALAWAAADFAAQGARAPLIDPFGGLKDLRGRRLRALGEKAFVEDPLRLLRAARLSAELDFAVEPRTAAFIKKHARRAAAPAPERVREELMRTLDTPRAAAAFRLLDRTRVLSVLFPEAEAMRASGHGYYGREGVLGHSLDAMSSFEKLMERLPRLFPRFHKPLRAHLEEPVSGHPRRSLLKLGELFHDAGKPATEEKGEDGEIHFYGHEHAGADIAARAAKRWRLSHDESASLTRLVRGHMRPGNLGNAPELTDRAIYRFYRDLEGDAVGLLVMALADHFTYLSERAQLSGKDPVFRAIRRMLENAFLNPQVVAPPKVVDGHQLMKALGLKPGPRVGEILEAIREAQAAGKVKTRQDALTLAKSLV